MKHLLVVLSVWHQWLCYFESHICRLLILIVYVVIMAALRSRCGHYIFTLWFLLSFYLLFFLS